MNIGGIVGLTIIIALFMIPAIMWGRHVSKQKERVARLRAKANVRGLDEEEWYELEKLEQKIQQHRDFAANQARRDRNDDDNFNRWR